MARRPLVILLFAGSLAFLSAGCGGRSGKLEESRRLIDEGTELRYEGLTTGNEKKLLKGQKMIDKGDRLRAEAMAGR